MYSLKNMAELVTFVYVKNSAFSSKPNCLDQKIIQPSSSSTFSLRSINPLRYTSMGCLYKVRERATSGKKESSERKWGRNGEGECGYSYREKQRI
jgi:hypothetical protein